jgi:hypothetical protein
MGKEINIILANKERPEYFILWGKIKVGRILNLVALIKINDALYNY